MKLYLESCFLQNEFLHKAKFVTNTRKNLSKCNHSICDYRQLYDVIEYFYNYLPNFDNFDHFVTMVKLYRNYWLIHPCMWLTFRVLFIHF